ncbi:hypothetical protein SBA5_1040006 [Candidatus Sulfotelmatomonas gaucii]|uniref:Uncharacterized protein n=1 Tax=Candidatus Sulfuritelmatomonas gaucii TaxID=2043161 RepID=A0A2N9L2Y8_9BACT|nr:hypothetical protein SBA5_1040006 [Candidatus Sulfotelmatomonas gaucii]
MCVVLKKNVGTGVTEPFRQSLLDVAAVRQTNLGQSTKMGMVYEYLTGHRFRAYVESIVEKFTEMEADLARERKTMTRL